jgi:hypothetical protein
MSGAIAAVQHGQPVLPAQNPVQPTTTSWLKSAAVVAVIAAGVISSLASFLLLPITTALITTGGITAAALAIYACISKCFSKTPAVGGPINLPVQQLAAPLHQPVVLNMPNRHQPLQPPLPLSTVHVGQGHIHPPGQKPVLGAAPTGQTVHVGQGHIQPPVQKPVFGAAPTGQTIHPGRGHTQVVVQKPVLGAPANSHVVDPQVAFANRVVDRPLESGKGGTIKLGLGSDQPLSGPTVPLGGSKLPKPEIPQAPVRRDLPPIGRTPVPPVSGSRVPFVRPILPDHPSGTITPGAGHSPSPRITPPPTTTTAGSGSTIRMGAGHNQPVSGATVPLGKK